MSDELAPGAGQTFLGVEVGELGAWVAVATGRRARERTWRARFSAPPDLNGLTARVLEGVRDVAGDPNIAGIAVASWIPGEQRRESTSALPSSLASPGDDLARTLSDLFAAPASSYSALYAAALSEALLGAGISADPFVYVHLGRDVVCSLVFHGEPAQGPRGGDGQLGHWRVAEMGPRCSCGEVGHLNPLCSSQSFIRLAIGLASQDEDALAKIQAATSGRAETLTAARAVALAGSGVEPLRELTVAAAEALGTALGQLTLMVNPEVIALGGPLGTAGGLFLDSARERLSGYLRPVRGSDAAPRLVVAALEPHSALTGAWLLAQRSA